jgi:hypothetical protein
MAVELVESHLVRAGVHDDLRAVDRARHRDWPTATETFEDVAAVGAVPFRV